MVSPLSARYMAQVPVTCGVVVAILLMTLIREVAYLDIFFIDCGLDTFYPWCFVTYPFAPGSWALLSLPLNIVVMLWGAAAELATGSSEYAAFLLFTTVTTGVLVFLTNTLLVHPVQQLLGVAPAEPYGYLGFWPVAEVIAFSLCRARGGTATAVSRVRLSRLTLQQMPLSFVWLALASDVVGMWLGWFDYIDTAQQRRLGFGVLLAIISFFVSWRYERQVSGAGNPAFALDAFIYPAPLRERVRSVATRVSDKLRFTPLRILLPTESGAGGAQAKMMPMPVFSGGAAGAVHVEGAVAATPALLPGTTAEEAERHRLIAREALARRLQQLQQESARAVSPAAEAAESEAKTA